MNLEKYIWKYLVKNGTKKEEGSTCTCGSCRYYDFTYESQLEGKRLWVSSLFAESSLYTKHIAILASPLPRYYRNKMDFVATQGKIGMRHGGFMNVYDVHESCIFDKNIDQYLSVLRTFKKYPDYDLLTHQGVIRYFVFRKTTHQDVSQMHLSVVVTEASEQLEIDFSSFLKESGLWDKFGVIALTEQPTLTDLSYGTIKRYVKPGAMLQDIIVNGKTITLELGLQSFFQANVSMFEVVLKDMQNDISDKNIQVIYDLYGGVGSIGIALSSSDTQLYSVESNPENTVYFEKNCVRNNVSQHSVITDTVENTIEHQTFLSQSLLVIDPPRTGMGPKVAAQLISKDTLPEYILYMSCNPMTQVADLLLLSQRYSIEKLTAYDMFPSTTHLETVAFLKRR